MLESGVYRRSCRFRRITLPPRIAGKHVAEISFTLVFEGQIACSNEAIIAAMHDSELPGEAWFLDLAFEHPLKIIPAIGLVSRAEEHEACYFRVG